MFRTRPRGPIFGPILASLPPGVGQNPDSRLPRRRQGRWEPGFGPIPGSKLAKSVEKWVSGAVHEYYKGPGGAKPTNLSATFPERCIFKWHDKEKIV